MQFCYSPYSTLYLIFSVVVDVFFYNHVIHYTFYVFSYCARNILLLYMMVYNDAVY